MDDTAEKAVRVINAAGRAPFVIAVDHASNRIPARWGTLGLPPSERLRHIAWDPGALAVAVRLSALLDAPVVHATVSRLVIDCNRDIDAPDLIPPVSELTAIPGNADISAEDRAHRIATVHVPFHAALTALLDRRAADDTETILVCLHSFTPVYKGVSRPWPIGLIHGRDPACTTALRDALAEDAPDLAIGWNEPYSALNGVTHTLEAHGDGRALRCTMIEIRNDEILQPAGVELWAQRLARTLPATVTAPRAAVPLGTAERSPAHG